MLSTGARKASECVERIATRILPRRSCAGSEPQGGEDFPLPSRAPARTDCPQRALDISAIGPLISALMTQSSAPRISKIPFLFGDLVLIAAATWIAIYGRPLGGWQYVAIIAAAGLGAWLAAWPFVLEFRALVRLVETSELSRFQPGED